MIRQAGTFTKRLREGLDRSLFKPAPPEAMRFGGWEGVVILVAFLVLASVMQLFRLGPSSALNSLWAEDGPIFLGEAMTHDFLHAVTVTHGEYLVVLSRLIGEVGAAVPLYHAPLAMNLTTVLIIALSGLAVWFASAGQIRSPYLRALLVALMVLCPVSTIEGVASPTNIAWYTGFAVFWLLLWRPATIWGACLGALLILVTGLSTPATFFFIPIVLLRAIAIRDRRDTLIVGAYAVATVIQVRVLTHTEEHLAVPVWTRHIITAFLQRVVDSSVLGLDLGGSTWAGWGWPLLIAIVAVVAIYLIAMLLRASSARLFAVIAIGTSMTMFMVSAYDRAPLGDLMAWPAGAYNTLGGRYAIIPTLLLISAALALLDSARPLMRGRPLAAIATAAVLLVSIVTSFDVREGNSGRGGPPWDESLRTATAQCYSEDLAEVPVSIAPEGWTMVISCDRLVSTDKPARSPNATKLAGHSQGRDELHPVHYGRCPTTNRRAPVMHVRVVRFTDVSAERMEELLTRIEGSDGPPPGVPATGLKVLFDSDQGTAVVLQYFKSAEDMEAGAKVFSAMDASETPGTRASVDMCEVRVERTL